MKKILFILLLLFPLLGQAQSRDYWAEKKIKKQSSEIQGKTAGSELKTAGTLLYCSFGASIIGIYASTEIYTTDKKNTSAEIITYAAAGGSVIFALISFGKLISAGNLLNEEKIKRNKKTSFNFSGDKLSLVYKF
jgi:hypothetical protein